MKTLPLPPLNALPPAPIWIETESRLQVIAAQSIYSIEYIRVLYEEIPDFDLLLKIINASQPLGIYPSEILLAIESFIGMPMRYALKGIE